MSLLIFAANYAEADQLARHLGGVNMNADNFTACLQMLEENEEAVVVTGVRRSSGYRVPEHTVVLFTPAFAECASVADQKQAAARSRRHVV